MWTMSLFCVQLCGRGMSLNAQLRVLNPHVGAALCGMLSCRLPTQVGSLVTFDCESMHGCVSSFGYAGTIAHAVLTAALCAAVDTAAVAVVPQLVCRHRSRYCSFPWRDKPHPFAQHHVTSIDGGSIVRSPSAGSLHAIVADHVVQGRVVFPGAGYLELARAGITTASVLRDEAIGPQSLSAHDRRVAKFATGALTPQHSRHTPVSLGTHGAVPFA